MNLLRSPRGVTAGLLLLFLLAIPITVFASPLRGRDDTVPTLAVSHDVSPRLLSKDREEVTVNVKVEGKGGRVSELHEYVRSFLPRNPLEVVLVMDRSNSMGLTDYAPTRMDAAKEAARLFLNEIEIGDKTALVSFNIEARVLAPLSENTQSTIDAIDEMSPYHKTAIGDAINLALAELEKGSEDALKVIVLLSDGDSNEGVDPLEAAQVARERGIVVFPIAIGLPGETFSEETLIDIGTATGGEYLYAPDEAELKRLYEWMAARVLDIAGVDVHVEINTTELFDVTDFTPGNLRGHGDGDLVYRYNSVPVGTEKSVTLTGHTLVQVPGETVPIIESIVVRYQSIDARDRVLEEGPVVVSFDGISKRVSGQAIQIDRISLDHTRSDYRSVNAYSQDSSVHATIYLKAVPASPYTSAVTVFNPSRSSGSSAFSLETSDDITASHILEQPGQIGRYSLVGSVLGSTQAVIESVRDGFFVVFESPEESREYARATEIYGDVNPDRGRSDHIVTLNPRDSKIMDKAMYVLDRWGLSDQGVGGITEPHDAARIFAEQLRPNVISYNLKDSDFDSDLDVLAAGHGDCNDMAALFASFTRALDIPIRGMGWVAEVQDDDGGEPYLIGHAFNEVHVSGRWAHADATWGKWDSPDVYLRSQQGLQKIIGTAETSPAVREYDRLTTLKYAVGMVAPTEEDIIYLDLDDGLNFDYALYFANRARREWDNLREPAARNVQVSVASAAGLSIELSGLSNDSELDPGEQDRLTLSLEVPAELAESVAAGDNRLLPITLEARYEDADGNQVMKSYQLELRLVRGQSGPNGASGGGGSTTPRLDGSGASGVAR